MKMKIEITEEMLGDIVLQDLRDLLEVMNDKYWESEDIEEDVAAVNRVIGFYGG